MTRKVLAFAMIAALVLAGCGGGSTTGGILTNNLTKESAVSSVAKVLAARGYTITEANETTGKVETDWLPDPASKVTGLATRYTAEVTDDRVSLKKFAQAMVDGEVQSIPSGGVDPKLLGEIAGLLGDNEGVQRAKRLTSQQQMDDPGDGP